MSATWVVVDRKNDAVVCGPFKSLAKAGAARDELERSGDERNLWIVRHAALPSVPEGAPE